MWKHQIIKAKTQGRGLKTIAMGNTKKMTVRISWLIGKGVDEYIMGW